MKVTVYYDYICPFCFLGVKQIEVLAKEFLMEVEWRGIEIHPEIPPQGVRRAKTLKLAQIIQDIKQMSEEDGFEVKLPKVVANSRLSLEVSEFARTKDKFNGFHNGVYEAYFQEGENIGNRDVILKLGEKAGLPVKGVEECLEKRTMLKRIEENKRKAQENLILGVPTFIFGNFPVHGVQSLESFRSIINRIIERSSNR